SGPVTHRRGDCTPLQEVFTHMKRRTGLTHLLAAAGLLAASGSAWAISPVYVDDDAAGGGDGTTPGTAVQTINEALTLVDDGGTIIVAAGEYAEVIDPTINVTLQGPNSGIDPNTGTRGAEAVLLAIAHATGPGDWGTDDFILSN